MSANWKDVFLNGHFAGMALVDFLKLSTMLFIQCHVAASKRISKSDFIREWSMCQFTMHPLLNYAMISGCIFSSACVAFSRRKMGNSFNPGFIQK